MIIIVNGTTYPANWFWPMHSDTQLMFEIIDDRALCEIAAEFENADLITKKSETEGDASYPMTGRVLRIQRPEPDKSNVQLTVERRRTL